jgi:hypothetical protein
MSAKPIIYQYVKVNLTILAALFIGIIAPVAPVWGQAAKSSLPDPITFPNKREMVMRAARAVLEDLGYKIELENIEGGRLTTRPYEFVSGSLTSSEVDKVAIKGDTVTGSWLRARYTVEALFEKTSPTQTMVTVRTQMEALNRELDGTEKYVPLQSLGSIEKRILGKISMKLLGTEPDFKDKKGFWDQKPASPTKVKKRPSV